MESGISEEMRASEKRVMATPETVRKLSASDPPTVHVQSGASAGIGIAVALIYSIANIQQ